MVKSELLHRTFHGRGRLRFISRDQVTSGDSRVAPPGKEGYLY